jgi:ribonucleoside-triphosphate reductase
MFDSGKIIDEYLSGGDITKDNANIGKSVNALYNHISEAGATDWWFTHHYNADIQKAHNDGFFHIHNLGYISTYCVGWNIEDLLLMGLKGSKGMQTSAPPKHFGSAMAQMAEFNFALQNEAAGAMAFSNIDTYLAPLIRLDHLELDEVIQILQEYKFRMNMDIRRGGQSVFSNVTLDRIIPKHLEDEPIIVGGKHTDDSFGSFQDEMDLFNEAWWKVSIRGDAEGRTQAFPIETLNVTEDFAWDDELMWKAIAKRGTPYFANFINSDMKPEDARSMCCRLRIDNRILLKKGGGLFGSSPLTGSIGVVTLNLPLIGYMAKDETVFFELLDHFMDLAMESLVIKRDVIEALTVGGFYPRSKIYLKAVHDRFGKYWANHFNTIGIVGMNEALINMFGHDISGEEGQKFSIKTLNHMRDRAIMYQEKYDTQVNIEATPAETAAWKLAEKAVKMFPDLVTSGTPEGRYFTNSTQLPVGLNEPLGFFLEHQSPIQKLYTGGTVFHVWNGENQSHWEGVSNLMRNICKETELSYTTYTPTTSLCPVHGHMAGEYWACPTCGAETEVWSRITGYFSEVGRWNRGKRQEFKDRTHFTVPK